MFIKFFLRPLILLVSELIKSTSTSSKTLLVFAEVVVLEVSVDDFVVVFVELTNFPSFPSLKYDLIY